MISIDNVLIDNTALFAIEHKCDPELFAPNCSCCRTYEVCVSADEIPLLDGCICSADSLGFVSLEDTNIIDQVDDGEWALDTDESGLCLLAIEKPNGALLCGLHASAMHQNLPPFQHKPRACALWPLALSEEGTPALGITQDAFDFPCNKPRPATCRRLDPGIASIIDQLYGESFRQRLEAAHAQCLNSILER